MVLNGLERGKDTVSFTKKGNIKLASKISRKKFLNTLKKSLVQNSENIKFWFYK